MSLVGERQRLRARTSTGSPPERKSSPTYKGEPRTSHPRMPCTRQQKTGTTAPTASPGTLPIGIDPSGHVVLQYLATVPWTDDFRTFSVGHTALLRVTPAWTLPRLSPAARGAAFRLSLQAVADRERGGAAPGLTRDSRGRRVGSRAVECVLLPHVYDHSRIDDIDLPTVGRHGRMRRPALAGHLAATAARTFPEGDPLPTRRRDAPFRASRQDLEARLCFAAKSVVASETPHRSDGVFPSCQIRGPTNVPNEPRASATGPHQAVSASAQFGCSAVYVVVLCNGPCS